MGKSQKLAKAQKIDIEVTLVHVTDNSWVGIATVGGIQVRGRRCDTALDGLQAILYTLARTDHDDAVLGLELSLEGATLTDALQLPGAS